MGLCEFCKVDKATRYVTDMTPDTSFHPRWRVCGSCAEKYYRTERLVILSAIAFALAIVALLAYLI